MPLATTTRLLAPVSMVDGTSKFVDTIFLPVAIAHGAVIVRARVEHVLGRIVGDAHQRIAAVHLRIVSVSRAVRQAVELSPRDLVSVPAGYLLGAVVIAGAHDDLERSLGGVDLGIFGHAIGQGVEDLAGRQHQQPP